MTNDMLHGRKVLCAQVTKSHKRIFVNTISSCWQFQILGSGCVSTESVHISLWPRLKIALFFEIILHGFRQFWCSFFGVSIYAGFLAEPGTLFARFGAMRPQSKILSFEPTFKELFEVAKVFEDRSIVFAHGRRYGKKKSLGSIPRTSSAGCGN